MKNVIISITTCIFALLFTTMPVCAAEDNAEYDARTEESSIVQTETQEIIAIIEPTCAEQGIIIYKDSSGNQIIERTEPLEHTPGEWQTTREPGAFSYGMKIKECTACGTVVDTEILEPKYNFSLVTVLGFLACGLLFAYSYYLNRKFR